MDVIWGTIVGVVAVSVAYYVGMLSTYHHVRAAEAQRDLARKEAGKLSRRIGKQRSDMRKLREQLRPYLPAKTRPTLEKPIAKPQLPA